MIKNKGHLLFGKLFKLIMSFLGIIVATEFKVMSEPPRIDILVINKKKSRWTEDQLQLYFKNQRR